MQEAANSFEDTNVRQLADGVCRTEGLGTGTWLRAYFKYMTHSTEAQQQYLYA